MILCYILIMLAASWVHAYVQRIQLFPYRQEDSETNCEHGLISDKDTVVFTVQVSGDIQNSSVYVQRKSKSDSMFILFKEIVINGTITMEDGWKNITHNFAQVTIKDKAKTENSGARIRVVLVSSKKDHIYSDEQIYPDIRESTDLKIRMLINGVETPIQNISAIHGNGSDIVKYECQSKASPCWIQISADDLTTPLISKGYVQHTSKLKEQNITIAYASCTLNGNINTLNCRFERDVIDAKVSNEESNANMINLLTALLVISVIFIFGLLIYIFCFSRRNRRRRISRFFRCIKPKSETDLDGNNAIKDTTLLTVNDETNSPTIHVSTSIDTDVDEETDKKGERLPLIRFISNRKRHKDGEEGNVRINSTEGLAIPGDNEEHGNESIKSLEASPPVSPDKDVGFKTMYENVSPCHVSKGPMIKSKMDLVDKNDRVEGENNIGHKTVEKREMGPIDITQEHCGIMEKEEANKVNDLNEIMTQSGNQGKDNTFLIEAPALQRSLLANDDLFGHMDEDGNNTDVSNTLIHQHFTQPEPDNSESLSNRRIYQTNNQEEILHNLNIQIKRN